MKKNRIITFLSTARHKTIHNSQLFITPVFSPILPRKKKNYQKVPFYKQVKPRGFWDRFRIGETPARPGLRDSVRDAGPQGRPIGYHQSPGPGVDKYGNTWFNSFLT
jgi:hypothetical protein